MTTMSGVFALVDGRKNTTSASCTVLRPSWAQVHRSGMQQPKEACTRAPPQCKSCPSYLSHSALLINAIAIITSSGRFSIHYTSFISVTHTMHLNYYHMQCQYKSVIQFVQQYKNLYAKFEAYLRRNEGLIRKSVLFKSWKLPIV